MFSSEDSRVKIPCILHLVRLGYRYLKNAVGQIANITMGQSPPGESLNEAGAMLSV